MIINLCPASSHTFPNSTSFQSGKVLPPTPEAQGHWRKKSRVRWTSIIRFGLASLKVDCYLHPPTSFCHYIRKSQKNRDPVSAGKNQQGPDVTEIFVCLGCEALHVNQIEFAGKVTPWVNSLLPVYHRVEDGFYLERRGLVSYKQKSRIKESNEGSMETLHSRTFCSLIAPKGCSIFSAEARTPR